jgi:hypothetical protein
MTTLLTMGMIVFAVAASFGCYVRHLDRELRRASTRLTEQQHRDTLREVPRTGSTLLGLRFNLLVPIHWRRELHGARGVALIDRLWLSLVAVFLFLAMGVMLLEPVVVAAR